MCHDNNGSNNSRNITNYLLTIVVMIIRIISLRLRRVSFWVHPVLASGAIQRSAEYSWNSTVWNLEFNKTIPFVSPALPVNWGPWQAFWATQIRWDFQPYSANLSSNLDFVGSPSESTLSWLRVLPVSLKQQLLLREPWPCNQGAETAIQPQIWCSHSWFSNLSSYPEECLFHRHRYGVCPLLASLVPVLDVPGSGPTRFGCFQAAFLPAHNAKSDGFWIRSAQVRAHDERA